jgi:hypothetical protein
MAGFKPPPPLQDEAEITATEITAQDVIRPIALAELEHAFSPSEKRLTDRLTGENTLVEHFSERFGLPRRPLASTYSRARQKKRSRFPPACP